MPYLHKQKQSRVILLSAIILLILVGLYFYFYNQSSADIIRSTGFAPTVNTITPLDNATVSGVVNIQVRATAPTSNSWIQTLRIYDGNTLLKTVYGNRTSQTLDLTHLWDTSKTTYKDWDTTKPGEQRLLNAIATDINGRKGIDRTFVTLTR